MLKEKSFIPKDLFKLSIFTCLQRKDNFFFRKMVVILKYADLEEFILLKCVTSNPVFLMLAHKTSWFLSNGGDCPGPRLK